MIAYYVFIDTFNFKQYYEVSYYSYISCISLIALYYVYQSYIRLILLNLLIENLVNTYLAIVDDYWPELQYFQSITLVLFCSLNLYQKLNFKKIKLEKDIVYKIYKTSTNLSLPSFLLSLFIGYPVIAYYYNDTIYYCNRKSKIFEKKEKAISKPMYAKACLNTEKTLSLLKNRIGSKYHIIFNNCLINKWRK